MKKWILAFAAAPLLGAGLVFAVKTTAALMVALALPNSFG
jgi:hypothetical protein